MDGQIKLRNADTEQECTFDDSAAAEHFTQEIADADAWQLVHDQPATGKTIAVDLTELRAALDADAAPEATSAAAPGSITATAE